MENNIIFQRKNLIDHPISNNINPRLINPNTINPNQCLYSAWIAMVLAISIKSAPHSIQIKDCHSKALAEDLVEEEVVMAEEVVMVDKEVDMVVVGKVGAEVYLTRDNVLKKKTFIINLLSQCSKIGK